ncbi:RagB/SusD family nutrient uptake outer membrane protein [Flavobacterium sp.]|uniref:RagB/SusD family nutrient uptake outer membrane protein n=1 Tax=Flavobacterium sp. TaxID=239 RepID=UPI0031D40316
MKNIQILLKKHSTAIQKAWVLFFPIVALVQGCDNFVETAPPHSQISSEVVFEDGKTADAAASGIYINMRDGGILSGSFSGLTYKLGLYADELDNYAPGINFYYGNSLFDAEGGILDTWTRSYSQLYSINALMEGVLESQQINQKQKDRLQGEGLFLRALIHFYLMNLYGAVPYAGTTDYKINSRLEKLPPAEMTEHIIQDLNQAKTLLNTEYPSPFRIRPNRFTAYALLSRVLLYVGRWDEAADAASAVLNSPLYSLPPASSAFLKESQETIWQLQPNGAANNTIEAQLFIFTAGPPPQVALTASLLNAFEPADQRKIQWIKAVAKGTDIWYHPFKYKERAASGTSKEYSIIFRLAEQYLIRAEARAEQGDLIGAKQDLDAVRTRAGLNGTLAASEQDIKAAVMQERRIEFFTELGHRFFDLKRYEKLDAALHGLKPGWNSTDQLWPLPSQELSANPKLNPQNSGY